MSTKQTEALKLALECIEAWDRGGNASDYWRDRFDAITAIKAALADNALDKMAENARELGLDYEPIVEQVEDSVGMGHKAWDMVDPKELAKAFHEALAEQPAQQQEPVAWRTKNATPPGGYVVFQQYPQALADLGVEIEPLYTSQPASKPWVGLTNQELIDLTAIYSGAPLYCAIEAKLREKNT